MGSSSSSGPGIKSAQANATSPGLLPNRSDSGTGIGRAGDDQLSLIAGATEGIRIYDSSVHIFHNVDVSGNITVDGIVGIGTDNPLSKFHVDGESGTPSTDNAIMHVRNSDTNIGFQMGAANSYGWIRAVDVLVTTNNVDLILQPSGTDANVGIGKNNPSSTLDINGDLNVDGSIFQNGTELGKNLSTLPTSNSDGNNGDYILQDNSIYFKANGSWRMWETASVF